MRALLLTLLLTIASVTAFAASFELERKHVDELFKLHYASSLKATGHPWALTVPDHRIHVVQHDDLCYAVIADQQAQHTNNRVWFLFAFEDGAWKELPYSVGGVAIDAHSVMENRDRMVMRLHLNDLPTRIVDSLLDVRDFMPILDPESPQ